MKYIKLFGILLMLIALSYCAKEKELLNCEIVDEIMESDQYYRIKHNDILSPYFYLLDSLIIANGHPGGMDDSESLDNELRKLLNYQVESLLPTRPQPKQTTLDSIWKLQGRNDSINTIRLINIVKEMGLPSIDTLSFYCGRRSFMVFVHTPDELKEEVRKLIDPELKDIDEYQYDHIMWHLNGRK